MAFGRFMVVKGFPAGQMIDYEKYRLNKSSAESNSIMEFEIQADGKNYAYGFVFNNTRIVEEWLYEVTKRSEKKIFERNPQFTGNYDLALLLKLNEKEEDRQFIRFTAK